MPGSITHKINLLKIKVFYRSPWVIFGTPRAIRKAMEFQTQSFKILLCVAALTLSTLGCSKQAFQVGQVSQQTDGPGKFTIPAKIDILLAQDNTGSMHESLAQFQSQLPGFLDGLEKKGWDYRFAITPLAYHSLSNARPLNQIQAARYDANWLSLGMWVEPFPSAFPHEPSSVSTSYFRTPWEYGHYLTQADMDITLNNKENGFEVIYHALTDLAPGTGFIRDDATTVVIAASNEDDDSGVNYCTRPSDGFVGPCDLIGQPDGSYYGSLEEYQQLFTDFHNSNASIGLQFHSAVGFQDNVFCLGGMARRGHRYIAMAGLLGGQAQDVCSTPLHQVLNSISDRIDELRLDFIMGYLVVGIEPLLNSIKIVKYPGGDVSQAYEVPLDGWEYIGYQEQFPVIESPKPADKRSGFFIKLKGAHKLFGYDAADIFFLPADGEPSAG